MERAIQSGRGRKWRWGRAVAASAAVMMALAALGVADAADWPQWRGPARDEKSAETGLVNKWPDDGPPLAWKTTGLGEGFSTVSVAGGRIYTMGDKDGDTYVLALDEKNKGKPVWSTKVGRAGESGGYRGPRSAPTVDGKRLYVLGREGELACLEAKDGKVVWSKHLQKDFGGNHPDWGYTESLLVDGDKLICTPGGDKGMLMALNKNTGATLWRSKDWTDRVQYSSPIVADVDGVRQYIQLTMGSVAGVAADDGRLLWKAPFPGQTAVICTPIYKDNHVFVTANYGVGCALIKLTKDGTAFSAEQVYFNREMKVHHGGVVLLGDHLYAAEDDGALKCMELMTGKVVWRDRCAGKGSVTYADGHLYVRGEQNGEGPIALVEANPKQYVEKGMFEQPDASGQHKWPHPVVANGKLYIRDQDVLLCYDVKGKK